MIINNISDIDNLAYTEYENYQYDTYGEYVYILNKSYFINNKETFYEYYYKLEKYIRKLKLEKLINVQN